MRYLLDTNICIYIAKQKPASVLAKFEHLDVGSVGMSVITYSELCFGVRKSQHPKKSMAILEALASMIPVLPMPTNAASCYGNVRCKLAKAGTLIGNNDLWIASHALAVDLIVVTNNIKEFARVPKIKLENWVS